jgi:hypothetical protein
MNFEGAWTADELSVIVAPPGSASGETILEAQHVADAAFSAVQPAVTEMVEDSDAAGFHTANAERYQLEQSKAAADGNWALAHELSLKVVEQRAAAADYGAGEEPVVDAQKDAMNLDNARWQQRSANENAAVAADFAARGDYVNAATYSDLAATQQSRADDSGHAGTLAADQATGAVRGSDAPEHSPDADAGQAVAIADPSAGSHDSVAASAPEPSADA